VAVVAAFPGPGAPRGGGGGGVGGGRRRRRRPPRRTAGAGRTAAVGLGRRGPAAARARRSKGTAGGGGPRRRGCLLPAAAAAARAPRRRRRRAPCPRKGGLAAAAGAAAAPRVVPRAPAWAPAPRRRPSPTTGGRPYRAQRRVPNRPPAPLRRPPARALAGGGGGTRAGGCAAAVAAARAWTLAPFFSHGAQGGRCAPRHHDAGAAAGPTGGVVGRRRRRQPRGATGGRRRRLQERRRRAAAGRGGPPLPRRRAAWAGRRGPRALRRRRCPSVPDRRRWQTLARAPGAVAVAVLSRTALPAVARRGRPSGDGTRAANPGWPAAPASIACRAQRRCPADGDHFQRSCLPVPTMGTEAGWGCGGGSGCTGVWGERASDDVTATRGGGGGRRGGRLVSIFLRPGARRNQALRSVTFLGLNYSLPMTAPVWRRQFRRQASCTPRGDHPPAKISASFPHTLQAARDAIPPRNIWGARPAGATLGRVRRASGATLGTLQLPRGGGPRLAPRPGAPWKGGGRGWWHHPGRHAHDHHRHRHSHHRHAVLAADPERRRPRAAQSPQDAACRSTLQRCCRPRRHARLPPPRRPCAAARCLPSRVHRFPSRLPICPVTPLLHPLLLCCARVSVVIP